VTEIVGKILTVLEVAPDGGEFRLNLIDRDGRPAAVTLPSDCLNELLLMLPRVVAQALRARYRDDTLRIAYTLERWRIERAEEGRLILTIETEQGLEMSFLVAPSDLERMAGGTEDYSGEPLDEHYRRAN
jgi:hypothetical protein